MYTCQMLKRKIVLTLCAFCLMSWGLAGNVWANSSCPETQILQIGPYSTWQDASAVLLKNVDSETVSGWPAGEERWFSLTSSIEDKLLATGLTAVSLGKKVKMCPKVTGDFVAWHDIGAFYLLPDSVTP